MRVALLIAAYAVIAILAYFFVGTQVPPCFGRVPDGRISQACYDSWLASRPWWQALLDTPYVEIAAFLAASAVTIWISRRRRI